MQEMEKTVRFIAYLNSLKWSISNGFVNIKENCEGDGEFRVIYNDKRQVLVFDYDVDDFVPVEDWFHVPFTVKVDRRFSNLWYVECVLPEGTIMITDMDWYYSKTPKKASGSGDNE